MREGRMEKDCHWRGETEGKERWTKYEAYSIFGFCSKVTANTYVIYPFLV